MPEADGAAHIVQPIVRGRAGGLLEEAASRRHRFVGNDGAFGQEGAEGQRQRLRREGTARQHGTVRLLHDLAVHLDPDLVRQPLECPDRVLGEVGQPVDLAAVGGEDARLVRVREEGDGRLGADQDQMADVLQDGQRLVDGVG
jgi:hypothetical protein